MIPKMPVLFIGHGSPMNMMLDNEFTRSLSKLGSKLPRPDAVMVISAHWLSRGTFVNCEVKPRLIYDFGGFPPELYTLRYDCAGSPEHARMAADSAALKDTVRCNDEWGLDHASYSILRYMFPKADIPVFEMSLDYSFNSWNPKPVRYHYDLAKGLSALRRKGVLIIGSGNMVHNLDLIDFGDMYAPPYDWAAEIDEKIKTNLVSGNDENLVNYTVMGKTACMAVPTLDHYLPMIYAIALREKDDELRFTFEGFQNRSISMRGFWIG